jgi:hypothetical protein
MLHAPINSAFMALIPKVDNPLSFVEVRPISLFNCVSKIISKFIARRIKEILTKKISKEKFVFLEGCQIHKVVGVAQEGRHSLKTRNIKGVVIKMDLSKAYDRVNWLYIRMLLTYLGFGIAFIIWIMSFFTIVSFSPLINGAASPFFHPEIVLNMDILSHPSCFF